MTERKTNTAIAKALDPVLPKTDTKETKTSLPFQPSQNWALLQKSLPQATTSKKRKRTSNTETTNPPKPKAQKIKPSLSTYNPWKPHASTSRSAGNPLLVLTSEDKNIKYAPLAICLTMRSGRYVAIDCEMVGTGPKGTEDLLARVAIVNYLGQVLLDVFVKPTLRVTDWRTKYSGIRPADLLNDAAQPFEKVQEQVREIIQDRVLVGHAVQGDLNVLKLSHPKDKLRDTGLYEPFRTKYAAGKMPALKKVVQGELDVSIQEGEHDPVEDAQAAMALFRIIRMEYEKAIRMGQLHGIRPKVENTVSLPVDPTKNVKSNG